MGRIIDVSEALLELGLSSASTEVERAVVSMSIVRAEAAVKRHLFYDPVRRERIEFYPHQDYTQATRETVWEVEGTEAILRGLSENATLNLQVQHVPIRSVLALYIDFDGRAGSKSGAFGAGTLKTEGTDYWPNYDGVDSSGAKMCRDGIIRSEGAWPTTPGTVKIVYTAGYTAAELHGQDLIVDASPILEAVLIETVRRVKRRFAHKYRTGVGFGAGAFSGERLGDYGYTVDSASLDRMVGGTMDILPETRDMLAGFVNVGWPFAS